MGNAFSFNGSEIFVINEDGSGPVNLTHDVAFDDTPAWSPDGGKIAFASTGTPWDYGSDIYVMNVDGSHRRGLTQTGVDWGPAWSPDGSRIAFTSFRDNNSEIYVMNADGSNVVNLTHAATGEAEPSWSPDGSKIAFTSDRGGNADIYVMNADGSQPIKLTQSSSWDGSPAWSPDGTRIAFASRRDGNQDIYVMNSDGSNQTNLTNTSDADESSPDWQAQQSANPIDDAQFFVQQHYRDFLNREPDVAGLAFWTNEITSCGTDAQCIEVKRINVSAAFFLSIEFQQTGYFVYRMYKTAYSGGLVPLRREEFVPDTSEISQGVIVGAAGWEQQLENNKNAYCNEFVGRSRFLTAFPQGMTSQQFVDTLNSNAGGVLSQSESDQLVSELASGLKTRAQVLRSISDDADLVRMEFNKAFVLMQYFGYLHRNPNDPPDTDFAGYTFWLNKLNQFNGDFVQAEMVKAFINSNEYRSRFVNSCLGCWDY